jgi:exosortase
MSSNLTMANETPMIRRLSRPRLLVGLALLGSGLLWSYWPALRDMVDRWSHDPRYSHGYLVPGFALYLLWSRRRLAEVPAKSTWWGVVLLAAAAALRLAGARYYVGWFDGVSLLPALAGLALLLGGWPALRWSWPSIGFLIFMIPLPYRLELAMGAPLQRLATLTSNYALQTLGQPAVADGNIIYLGDFPIGVVEACNGLGMLFMFFAFATAAILVMERPWVDKALILLSAAPIALGANATRIVATGLLHQLASTKVADTVYHDLAGWLMMPLALAALWIELWLLSRLFVEAPAPSEGMMRVSIIPAVGQGLPRGDRQHTGRAADGRSH